ncbi:MULTISPECIES: ABC transporter substrate-binding protein [unclassified Chelatococcus]|jgi:iron complex transport system substrate-binding protein|uniref:ABC transporter substrate-binding protein n=1 Tax=unclassified Chelatococcus TaxID=2638111 RepID=UPI0020C0CFDB|nr:MULTISPECIES: ABC transporter substrate-binding protein [unclassified Chelatococcus]MCO5076980.1 ABC transporter substrate-binding protein [Chelatococcus sp.]CAH1671647.1 Iron complex transport system substrate-binding protein [Hyphomicrobiales bacterium]CAH1676144.1 Iron complex transport system substrate-binding protein [Hyphomicrobiales bacterium]
MGFLHRTVVTVVALAALTPAAVMAQAFTVKDVAGREVKFDKPVDRVILGEGRLLYSVAAIEPDPFSKVVGWRNDLMRNDDDTYKAYVAKFPKAKDVPFLGNLTDGTLQTETVVNLKPDAMILTIGDKKAADEVKLEEMLGKIGVKVVYVDFREHILKNTEPSLKVLGQLFGKSERADEVAAFWRKELARVADKLKAANPKRPNVFMYRAAGLVECCGTFGPDNFGLMADLAGGHNIGSDFLPGYTGSINAEQVVATNPDVIVVTGANWSQTPNAKNFVNVGPGAVASAGASREALAALMKEPAFTGSKAVKNNDVHAIWHQFYTSPYQFVAIQQMAKWFHPELFADLDPDATFKEFHNKFLPIAYQPGYWISLDGGKK